MVGVTLLGAYSALVSYFPDASITLYQQRQTLATIIAGFSFTMLGFLAALIGLMFTNTASKAFVRYRNSGSLKVFLYLYFFSLAFLMLNFLVAVMSLSDAAHPLFMKASIALTIGSFLHILIIALIVLFNMIASASDE